MKPTIIIVAICVICAATLMSGGMETAPEEKQDCPCAPPDQTSVLPVPEPTPEALPPTVFEQSPPESSIPDDYYNISAMTSQTLRYEISSNLPVEIRVAPSHDEFMFSAER